MSTRDADESDALEREALRNEIQAAIAAGRDLGPEMDTHLADAALDRYRTDRAARQRSLAAQQQQAVAQRHVAVETWARTAVIVAAIGAIAAVISVALVAHPMGLGDGDHWFFPFWLFFLLPLFFGWRRRGRWGRYGYSRGGPDQPRSDARWERRDDEPTPTRHEYD